MAINPYVPATATGNGTQVDFTFAFPYLNQLHIKASINGVLTTAFTFFSASILRFSVAPAAGAQVRIFRETPATALSTVLQPGGPLPVAGLNDNFNQGLYYAQETQYDAANQSTAGLQAQITVANDNAANAVVTANAADAAADAATIAANNATTFTQAGAGATPRTVESKLRDVVSVKDFGAVGDGVADDTAAIQAAGTAAGGKPIFVDNVYLGPSGYVLPPGGGAISFKDGTQKNVWLHTRRLSGLQVAGAGPLIGYSPTAYMWDTLEDCSVTGDPFFVGGRYRHRFGGSSVTGGRIGLYCSLMQTAATSNANTNRNYVASQGSIYCETGDTGSNTTTDARGAFFGGGFAAYVEGAAQNLLNVTAAEFNTFIKAGASVKFQFGLQIAGANAQRGTGFDAALSISGLADTITHAGYGIGILFSSANGANPFTETSTIISTAGAATVQGGIDFSSYTITGQIIQGAHSKLSETGLTIGDSGGFSVINGGSQSTNASLMLRPKGSGSTYIQNASGTIDILRCDASGAVLMPNLPTSSTGLPAGALWNNSGTLRIA